MTLLLCLIGLLAAGALLMTAILCLFAPAAAARFLKSAGPRLLALLALLIALITLDEVIRALNSFAMILVAATVSTLAYFVREYRLGRPAHRNASRHAERTPVMPQYIPEEDQE